MILLFTRFFGISLSRAAIRSTYYVRDHIYQYLVFRLQ